MKGFLRSGAIILLMLVAMLTYARRENSGWIVFGSLRSGDSSLYLKTADGQHLRQISSRLPCGGGAQWSPDGRWLTYVDRCSGQSASLYRIRPGGAGRQRLDTPEFSRVDFQWSPDSRQIAASFDERGTYLIRAQGWHRIAEDYTRPFWSPDGERIYVQRESSPGSLYRIDADGGRVETVYEEDGTIVGTDWSPDGSRLVIGMMREAGSNTLVLMHPDGSDPQVIDLERRSILTPRWSPDGEWIAFLVGTSPFRDIFRVRIDGSALEPLTGQASDISSLQWSPDGRWLLFQADYVDVEHVYRFNPYDDIGSRITQGLFSNVSPQYAPVAGLDWRPLPLILAALGMLIASVAFPHRAIRVIMEWVAIIRRKKAHGSK